MDDRRWSPLAEEQLGVLARRQLLELGVPPSVVRSHLRAGRWLERTPRVLTTTTGPLARPQQLWVAALHAGPRALIGGLSAAEVLGMRHWYRETITVVVDDELAFEPVPGVRFFRSRRPFAPDWRAPGLLPTCRIEPALLLFAGYDSPLRTGQGALAAAVQQRLTTPQRLWEWQARMTPLRRARHWRALIADLAGGMQSVAEIDVRRACRRHGLRLPDRQRPRLDRHGVRRWTDCEWDVADGITVVLEVDGAFHLEVAQYTADMRRQRRLTSRHRIVVRCSAAEIRDDPAAVMEDLLALGVERVAA